MTPLSVTFGGRTFVGAANPSNWWLLKDGLQGWDDSPDSRLESEDIPGQDGGFVPVEQLLSGREVTFTGAHSAVSQEVAEAEVKVWGAALVKRTDLVLSVTDSAGVKSSRVWVRGRVRVKALDARSVQFQIVFYAPDPRKYGPTVLVTGRPAGAEVESGLQFPLFGDGVLDFGPFALAGGFYLSNAGSADSWPVHRVRGYLELGFTITSGSRQLRFDGPVPLGQEVVLSPFAGGRASMGGVDVSHLLTVADWAPVGPGETQQFSFAALGSYGPTAEATTEMRDAWY